MKSNKAFLISSYLLVFGLTAYLFPSYWCGRNASRWSGEDKILQTSLGRGVEQWLKRSLGTEDFKTGSALFDGEWLFGTYMMSGMGFGQLAIRYPLEKTHYLSQMEKCIERLLSEEIRAFDRISWGQDPLYTLEEYDFVTDSIHDEFSSDENTDTFRRADHAAYFGYLNLLLSFHRYLDKNSRFGELNDQISRFLASRLDKSSLFLLYTYPEELYVVDNCAVAGSLGLYAKAVGKPEYSRITQKWIETCRLKYMDQKTGLLYQAIGEDGSSYDSPRGSGSTLGSYFLSFADLDFSRQLYTSVKEELFTCFAGFGAVREYPKKIKKLGDIDSGPVVLGLGFSATGFSIAGAKTFEDHDSFRKLYSLTHLFGTPHSRKGSTNYLTGGPLGTAIMFTVLTALPESLLREL